MQKTLRKPENWQDFESLSKKLWGELWEIPHKIKKNGRLGRPSSSSHDCVKNSKDKNAGNSF